MEYIIVSDTSIVAINCGTKNNEVGNIVYRDSNGKLHIIDFETCAKNYKAEHSSASQCCIGERKIDEHYFVFYTSGLRTRIVFEKMYVGKFIRRHILSGNRDFRFLKLQYYIRHTKYTTLDLS